MTSIDKTLVSILEGDIESIDFGIPDLNKLFNSLTPEIKNKIKQIKTKETQIIILKKLKEKEDKKAKEKEEKPSIIADVPIETKPTLPEEKEKETEKVTEKELLNVPNEILQADEDEDEKIEIPKKYTQKSQQDRFNDLVKLFYNQSPFIVRSTNHELEVKFGTKGIKQLTRNDYDNVIRKLKSSGFVINGDSSGVYNLRVNCEFLDSVTGRFKLSDIRTEIKGLHNIKTYCETNDIKNCITILQLLLNTFIKNLEM